jgi:hypothetical protein
MTTFEAIFSKATLMNENFVEISLINLNQLYTAGNNGMHVSEFQGLHGEVLEDPWDLIMHLLTMDVIEIETSDKMLFLAADAFQLVENGHIEILLWEYKTSVEDDDGFVEDEIDFRGEDSQSRKPFKRLPWAVFVLITAVFMLLKAAQEKDSSKKSHNYPLNDPEFIEELKRQLKEHRDTIHIDLLPKDTSLEDEEYPT